MDAKVCCCPYVLPRIFPLSYFSRTSNSSFDRSGIGGGDKDEENQSCDFQLAMHKHPRSLCHRLTHTLAPCLLCSVKAGALRAIEHARAHRDFTRLSNSCRMTSMLTMPLLTASEATRLEGARREHATSSRDWQDTPPAYQVNSGTVNVGTSWCLEIDADSNAEESPRRGEH